MSWRLLKPKFLQILHFEPEAVTALDVQGIEYEHDADGLFIRAQDLESALEALDAKAVFDYPSAYKRTDIVVLGTSPSQVANYANLTVTAVANNAEITAKDPRRRIVDIVRDKLLPIVRKNIVVHLSCGEVIAPIHDDAFHIFIDAAPTQTAVSPVPDSLWSIATGAKDQGAWSASPIGRAVYAADDNDFSVAELVDNCFYVHYDMLGKKPRTNQLALFANVIHTLVEEIRADQIVEEIIANGSESKFPAAGANASPVRLQMHNGAKRPPYTHQMLEIVRHTLMPLINRPIVVHYGINNQIPQRFEANNEEYNVYLNCGGTVGTQLADKPKRLWNIPSAGDTGFSPTGHGVPVFEPVSLFAVADIADENNLFILFEPSGTATSRLRLIANTLNSCLRELDVDSSVNEIVASLAVEAGANAAFAVTSEGFNGRSTKIIDSLAAKILAPAISHNSIRVSNCRGENRAPLNNGSFNILVDSSPLGKQTAAASECVFGFNIPLERGTTAFLPSGRGVPIIDDAGVMIAELVDNNLYVHQSVIRRGLRCEAEALAHLLLRTRTKLQSQGPNVEALNTLFTAECRRQANDCKKKDATDLESAEKQIDDTVAAAIVADRVLFETVTTGIDKFGDEFDRLLEIENVLDVKVTANGMEVSTDYLYCVDPRTKKTHEIGQFTIRIYMNGSVRWINQTRTIIGYQGIYMYAPHVTSEGQACLGNMSDVFPRLIKDRQFDLAVIHAISFIENVNVNDAWGRFVSEWPVASTSTNRPGGRRMAHAEEVRRR